MKTIKIDVSDETYESLESLTSVGKHTGFDKDSFIQYMALTGFVMVLNNIVQRIKDLAITDKEQLILGSCIMLTITRLNNEIESRFKDGIEDLKEETEAEENILIPVNFRM